MASKDEKDVEEGQKGPQVHHGGKGLDEDESAKSSR